VVSHGVVAGGGGGGVFPVDGAWAETVKTPEHITAKVKARESEKYMAGNFF
jgi:hypothetical protein